MKSIRIIPRLDIKGPNLVKGIHLEGLRVLGKPEAFAKFYYESGADELMYQDVVASLYERNSLSDIITTTAKNTFIPLTVGGGLRTIDDIKTALRAGADKVSINTEAIRNPEFIKEACLKFGSSTIVVAIEAIKESNGKYLAYTDNGREYTGIEVLDWARKADEYGAGEIVLTSVDKEGTGEGYDLDLIKMVADQVSIPVIVHGGAGKKEDVKAAIEAGADAVAIASILHYDFIKKHPDILDEFEDEGNIEFLQSGKFESRFDTCDLNALKEYLVQEKIECRH